MAPRREVREHQTDNRNPMPDRQYTNEKNTVRQLKDTARNVSKDVFTPKQLLALIDAAPNEDWKGAILCGYYAGLRLRDIADLQWSAVDLQARTITVTTSKTGKDVI